MFRHQEDCIVHAALYTMYNIFSLIMKHKMFETCRRQEESLSIIVQQVATM